MVDANRGIGKYLLETREQKIKFLACYLIRERIPDLYQHPRDFDATVKELMDKVAKGDYTDKYFDPKILDSFIFEEFVEPPGNYWTSMRVVADAFGKIHYAQVARSGLPKNSEIDSSVKASLPKNLFDLEVLGDLNIYLEHPDSPFYFPQKKFTSNISTGGTPIILNGNPQVDRINRDVLMSLGIDPDHPQLPDSLQAPSSRIGELCKGDYPLVGIDYLKRASNGEFVLCEINKGPQLRPEAVGLPESTDEDELQAIMIDRVLSKKE
jgi:hypothetical protein